MMKTSPHYFVPFRWWDRFRTWGRCRQCHQPKFQHGHPGGWIPAWSNARALGDKSPAVSVHYDEPQP